MPDPRLLVVEHEDSCPPALVGEWLAEAGCVLEVCRPYAGDALPALTSYDAAVVLGGEMGAHDDDRHWWLAPLKAGIRDAVALGVPLLGICLGHQLVAAALGGVVARNPRGRTVGLQPVGWTEAVAGDALLGGHAGGRVGGRVGGRAIHWNDDVATTMPEGAVVLARTPDGEVQVARFAPRAWGIQAHPEADAAVIKRWLATEVADESARGYDPEAVLSAIAEAAPDLASCWKPVAVRFAELAGQARQERA